MIMKTNQLCSCGASLLSRSEECGSTGAALKLEISLSGDFEGSFVLLSGKLRS